MFKLAHIVDDEWVEHSYSPLYEGVAGKLLATAPGSDPLVFISLAKCLSAPLILLYVLHTPRGEGEPGRYESPRLSHEQFSSFVEKFADFLKRDSRFDLWVHSPSDQATIVWDRHNLIHAYGPLHPYQVSLNALGFRSGQVAVPVPHAHHYHDELDPLAQELLASMKWTYSPLRSEDEQ